MNCRASHLLKHDKLFILILYNVTDKILPRATRRISAFFSLEDAGYFVMLFSMGRSTFGHGLLFLAVCNLIDTSNSLSASEVLNCI